MPDKIEVLSKSHLGSLELTEEIIRMRAYELFEQRGYQHGHDMEDWLQAEAEVIGKKTGVSAEQMERSQESAAA
jgi:Protein of unknown function (DUF2934)